MSNTKSPRLVCMVMIWIVSGCGSGCRSESTTDSVFTAPSTQPQASSSSHDEHCNPPAPFNEGVIACLGEQQQMGENYYVEFSWINTDTLRVHLYGLSNDGQMISLKHMDPSSSIDLIMMNYVNTTPFRAHIVTIKISEQLPMGHVGETQIDPRYQHVEKLQLVVPLIYQADQRLSANAVLINPFAQLPAGLSQDSDLNKGNSQNSAAMIPPAGAE
ncbi:MAG: hypothetical protein HJJLKODD_00156 [Phycisphaerae bacterium]|nr:hypothetical protein [Phycisphaerae bacterium]